MAEKSKFVLHLWHEFKFGKYKDSGLTVEEIVRTDKKYIEWLIIKNICTFGEDVEDLL
jgi:hypothetical protein